MAAGGGDVVHVQLPGRAFVYSAVVEYPRRCAELIWGDTIGRMDHDSARAPYGHRYGHSLLVAVGCYVTIIAALNVGAASVPQPPGAGCLQLGCGSGLGRSVVLAVFVYIMVGLAAVTLGVAGLLARLLPSAIVVGTLSAVISTAIVAAVIAALVGSK